MRIRCGWIIGFLLLSLCHGGVVMADVEDAAPSPCIEWLQVPVPEADAAPPTDSHCDSQDLYYGQLGDGAGADFAAARACAYRDRTNHAMDFAGPGFLMMIYANGKGVVRNLPLAKRFACEAWGSSAEYQGRLSHIDELAKGDASAPPIDLCDDITSSHMIGACERRATIWQNRQREVSLDTLTKTWTVPERAAFDNLHKAADAFINESDYKEIDRSGSIRSYLQAVTQEELQRAFFDRVQACARGELPTATAQDFKVADTDLNALYAVVMKSARAGMRARPGSKEIVLPEGIRSSQLAWLKYREAWVEFGRLKYPAVNAEAWRADLTRERIRQWERMREISL